LKVDKVFTTLLAFTFAQSSILTGTGFNGPEEEWSEDRVRPRKRPEESDRLWMAKRL